MILSSMRALLPQVSLKTLGVGDLRVEKLAETIAVFRTGIESWRTQKDTIYGGVHEDTAKTATRIAAAVR